MFGFYTYSEPRRKRIGRNRWSASSYTSTSKFARDLIWGRKIELNPTKTDQNQSRVSFHGRRVAADREETDAGGGIPRPHRQTIPEAVHCGKGVGGTVGGEACMGSAEGERGPEIDLGRGKKNRL